MQNGFRLKLFVLLPLTLTLLHFQPVCDAQSKNNQKPGREEFGSSLKNLEWDSQKRRVVEKGINPAVEPERTGTEEVIKLETTLAVFPALVTDRNGKTISGLKKEDFIVIEDGVTQDVSFFALGDDVTRPRSIVLILEWSKNAYFIPESLKATEYFVSQLGPEDRVALVTGNLALVSDFTKDKAEVAAKLRDLREQVNRNRRKLPSERYEFTTLFAALNELIDEEDEQPIIIFQSDGGEAQVLRDQYRGDHPRFPSKKRQIGLADFDALIEKKRATIYSVNTWLYCIKEGMTEEEKIRMITESGGGGLTASLMRLMGRIKSIAKEATVCQGAMRYVADLSGGSDFCLKIPPAELTFWCTRKTMDSMDHATPIYAQILSTINQRYVIGYYPTNTTRDGKRRKVQIQVRNHPEYTIQSRGHYYAPTQKPPRK